MFMLQKHKINRILIATPYTGVQFGQMFKSGTPFNIAMKHEYIHFSSSCEETYRTVCKAPLQKQAFTLNIM
jgi:hypothetical protein